MVRPMLLKEIAIIALVIAIKNNEDKILTLAECESQITKMHDFPSLCPAHLLVD